MSAPPKPSDMASAAIPSSETASYRDRWEAEIRRGAFAEGAAAERARVAADLRARAQRIRWRTKDGGAAIIAAFQDTYAAELGDARKVAT